MIGYVKWEFYPLPRAAVGAKLGFQSDIWGDFCQLDGQNSRPLYVRNMVIQTRAKTTDNITVTGLDYSYKGLAAFRDFSLQADCKTIVLRGPSGCGKTSDDVGPFSIYLVHVKTNIKI